MTDFHAPYNFVPTNGKINGKRSAQTSWEEITKNQVESVRHDYWPSKLHNGRILCQITTQTPTVLGASQEGGEEEAKTVTPYTLNGKPALPGSSLRGLVSSIAETLSQSAMRVLHEQRLSVRKPAKKGLPAIGILKRHRELNKLQLDAFAIMSVPKVRGEFQLPQEWKKVFNGRSWKNILPVYLDGYREVNDSLESFGFLKKNNPECFRGKQELDYYYAKVMASEDSSNYGLEPDESKLKIKNNFLLGQKLDRNCDEPLLSEKEYIERGSPAGYIKGVIFVLGIENREKEMPKNKKHEYFLPRPTTTNFLDITENAIEEYQTLSKLVSSDDENLPFTPQGYPDKNLASGRLIRFDINNKGEVKELAWSAIWRKLVDGSVEDFLKKLSPDLQPWNAERNKLTPAETLFGVVGDGKHKNEDGEFERVSRNLASRVRFYDGQSVTAPELLPETKLKILSSPKLPSPSMYFRQDRSSHPIGKTELSVEKHMPRGRKYYLHHPLAQTKSQFWETANQENDKQKLKVTPIRQGESFWFHIDFDNLTDAELTLLLQSLCPSSGFVHRLGLGKPLGLGSVKLKTAAVFFIDRLARYRSNNLSLNRYHKVQTIETLSESENKALATLYPTESEALNQPELHEKTESDLQFIDKDSLAILCTLGDPNKLQSNNNEETWVHYPYLHSQRDKEIEGFKWFVENDKAEGNAQQMGKVKAGETLPTMRSLPTKKPTRNKS